MYTALIFENPDDFEAYKNVMELMDLKPRRVFSPKNPKNLSITVLLKMLPIPDGLLITKTSKGREVKIKISSGLFLSKDPESSENSKNEEH
jgi:hypothetical protein